MEVVSILKDANGKTCDCGVVLISVEDSVVNIANTVETTSTSLTMKCPNCGKVNQLGGII